MKTESKSKKEIASDVIQDIRESVNEFLDEFSTNTKDTNNSVTLDISFLKMRQQLINGLTRSLDILKTAKSMKP